VIKAKLTKVSDAKPRVLASSAMFYRHEGLQDRRAAATGKVNHVMTKEAVMNKQLTPKRHWLLTLILLLPLSAVAETIQVDPLEFDYGEVMVGSASDMPMEFTITSTGPTPLLVQNVSIVDDTDGHFTITGVTPGVTFPHTLDVDEELVVEVTFKPLTAGSTGATLRIVSDATNGDIIYIPLQGEGVVIAPTPRGLMDYLLVYYNAGVVNGTILGVGTGKRAEKRIDKFDAIIDSADAAIDASDDAGACEDLNDAYLRVDGIPKPNDYLVGPAVPTLSALIQLVMESLGCPEAYGTDRCPSWMRAYPPVGGPPSVPAACGKR